jgi:hypothetical protein
MSSLSPSALSRTSHVIMAVLTLPVAAYASLYVFPDMPGLPDNILANRWGAYGLPLHAGLGAVALLIGPLQFMQSHPVQGAGRSSRHGHDLCDGVSGVGAGGVRPGDRHYKWGRGRSRLCAGRHRLDAVHGAGAELRGRRAVRRASPLDDPQLCDDLFRRDPAHPAGVGHSGGTGFRRVLSDPGLQRLDPPI